MYGIAETYLVLGPLVVRGHHVFRDVDAYTLCRVWTQGLRTVSKKPRAPRIA